MPDLTSMDMDDLLGHIGEPEWNDDGVDTIIPHMYYEDYIFDDVYIMCEEREEGEDRDWEYAEIELTAYAVIDDIPVTAGITVEGMDNVREAFVRLSGHLKTILGMKKRRRENQNPNMME